MIKRIAVFCGSATGTDPIFREAAIALSDALLAQKIGLIYGGGSIGLMGVMADHIMAGNGEVIGVIPKKIYDWEVGHEGITELHVVDSMHERKAKMAEMSDAFIAMPGGIGTLDELIEIFTWRQLGYHHKPVALFNVSGYFDQMIGLFDHMVKNGFLQKETRDQLILGNNPENLIGAIREE